jgi:hypothetical protein
VSTIYSFKDTVTSIVSPAAGSFLATGQVGIGHLIVSYTIERTVQDMSADGNCMISYVSGSNGHLGVEVQQTSALNNYLVSWFNILTTAADADDVSNWASTTILITSLLDGTTHSLTGVSPGKIPDKTYGPQGARLNWTLMAGNVVTTPGVNTSF